MEVRTRTLIPSRDGGNMGLKCFRRAVIASAAVVAMVAAVVFAARDSSQASYAIGTVVCVTADFKVAMPGGMTTIKRGEYKVVASERRTINAPEPPDTGGLLGAEEWQVALEATGGGPRTVFVGEGRLTLNSHRGPC
jgi:hypothetical protein